MGNTPSSERDASSGATAQQQQQQQQQQQGDRLRRYNGVPGFPAQPQPSELAGGGKGATVSHGSDERSPSPTLRRASTTGTQPAARSPRASRTSASLRQATERAAQLSPTRTRARSGSSGGVLAAARKPSSGAPSASQAPAFRRKKSIELTDADDTAHSSMTPLRRPPGTLVPPPFEPNLVVSPYPSPSVATVARHASGTPSHFSPSPTATPTFADQAYQTPTADIGVSTTGMNSSGYVSAPQPITGIAAFAPAHRSIFHEPHLASGPDAGLSLGTVASTPAGQSPSDAMRHGTGNRDPLGRQLPAALPSYLKIPTLIPSTYASPTGSVASSPTHASPTAEAPVASGLPASELRSAWMDDASGPSLAPAGAAAAVLNTEDVVIGPGAASKVSSPEPSQTPLSASPTHSLSTPLPADEIQEAVQAAQTASEAKLTGAGLSLDTSGASRAIAAEKAPLSPDTATDASRAATPTPGQPSVLRNLTPQTPSDASRAKLESKTSVSEPGRDSGERRRSGVQVFTGVESGLNTPAFPGPAGAGRGALKGPDSLSASTTSSSRTATAPASERSASAAAGRYQPPSGPLRPVTVTWRGGGKEVFVTGTFANEWRSKVPLKRPAHATGSSRSRMGDHTIVLHLEPGTHRLKFIVDDRWRVSRDLPTATDGSGNLVNYIEMPILDDPERKAEEAGVVTVSKQQRNALAPRGMGGHATAHDLQAAKRQAEVKRGDLDEVFGPDKAQEEVWTQEIPSSITRAQQLEEVYRDVCESAASRGREPPPPPLLPLPPLLPRQLSTVLLNASPANPAVAQATGGAVDDLSLLPAPPNSAILHHLTASAIKNGCVAVGTTIRFKKKYVSTLYYSPCA